MRMIARSWAGLWACVKIYGHTLVLQGRIRMAQAIVDPAELRRFAQNLKSFNGELTSQLGSLHGQLMHLGSTWRDQEHHRFQEEFENTMKVVQRFVTATEEHIPYLLRKAERVEEYMQQR
jgi:WXG100 family type VII secretion target